MVFLVALPLCLGVALASNAPLVSGLVSGIVGGLLVAWLSGSHTSVSGPAAGLTAIVYAQVAALGSFEAFLVAVVVAGVIQIVLGLLRAGTLGAFFPSSVIKGLLSAIGIILVLKQIPHLFGNNEEWLGTMSFAELDGGNTFSNLFETLFEVHAGATLIGLTCLAVLIVWDRTPLKNTTVPSQLGVVVLGVAMAAGLERLGGGWAVLPDQLVQVPVADSLPDFAAKLASPDFSAVTNPAVYMAALTIAIVASLETLLNVEAVDKLDPCKRVTPPNRELLAQGVGNIGSGLLGGLPITSVVVRSSVGIAAGGQTRMTCFIHGVLLLVLILLVPALLNRIPLACLAAVLMVTGFKLAKPAIFQQMWAAGRNQFTPFAVTVVAIVMTDLLIGIFVGLTTAMVFILQSNLKVPLRKFGEKDLIGDVVRVQLSSQVSFLNRAALLETLNELPDGGRLVLDAQRTVYIDSDVLDLIKEFESEIAPVRGIEVGILGFEGIEDRVTVGDVSTPEIQKRLTPEQVLQLLKEGNESFATGRRLVRDRLHEVAATSAGESPLVVLLACMDSRVATEEIFDAGLGSIFSIRVAGNIASEQALGSMEYGCAVAGAKVLLVLGHTRCGAVTATVDQMSRGEDPQHPGEHENLAAITGPIAEAVRAETETTTDRNTGNQAFVERVAVVNVRRTLDAVSAGSRTLRQLIEAGQVLLVGGIYDVATGRVEFLDEG